jgi:hypothetical protein
VPLSPSLSLSPPLHLDPEKAALLQQRDERPECSSLGGERAPRTHETASGTAVRLQACGRNEGAAACQWTSEARMEAVALFQASSVTCYMEFAFNFSYASRAILAVIFSSSSLPSHPSMILSRDHSVSNEDAGLERDFGAAYFWFGLNCSLLFCVKSSASSFGGD